MSSKLTGFLRELKRRKVYRVALVYAVVGFSVAQGAEYLFQILEFPLRAAQFVAIVIALGFPVALVLAWAYEVKPEEHAPRRPTDAAAGAEPNDESPSIVVLPFDNMSPDQGDSYFSDGLTEEIITDLSALHSLRVISRSSAVALKGTQKDLRTIGRELDVRYVLEGSVRKAGDDLRITAQLIDASSDRHLWAEKYDGKLGDVFGIQEKVSRSIVESLRLQLNPEEDRALSSRPIRDPEAYDTYLLAMHECRTLTPEGVNRALHLTHQAIELVGDNARLFAVLAYCHYLAYDFGIRYEEATLLEAENWASKALQIDPDAGLAHYAMGVVRYKRGDLEAFVQYAKRAVEIDHGSDAAALVSFVLCEVGKIEEARHYAEMALERDPLSFFSYWGLGALEIFTGRPDLALARIDNAPGRMSSRDPFPLWWEAQAAGYAGNETRATETLDRLVDLGAGFLSDMGEVQSRALAHDRDGVVDLLERTGVCEMARTDEYFPLYLANALALVGECAEALSWLEQAVSWGFTNHEFLSKHDRYLEPLRGEPRFNALIEIAREKQREFRS